MQKLLSENLVALEQSDIEKNKDREATALNQEITRVQQKMKKLRIRIREEDKKYLEAHDSKVSAEERCRNMQEII